MTKLEIAKNLLEEKTCNNCRYRIGSLQPHFGHCKLNEDTGIDTCKKFKEFEVIIIR